MAKKKKEMTVEEMLEEALVKEEEWPYEVPGNWVWTRLGNLAKTISKGTTPKGGKNAYIDKGIAFLRIENITENGIIDFSQIKFIDDDIHNGYLKRSKLAEGDILISIAGTLGRTTIVKKEHLPMNTNQAVAFIRLVNGDKVSNKYIENALASTTLQRILLDQTKVTSIPNLTLEIISNCPVPLPPLAEQQRIVDRIESLFEKLDQAKDLIQEALDSFENRKAAILHKAFTGELTKKWREVNGVGMESWEEKYFVGIGKLERGRSKHRPRNAPELFGGIYPFIQTGDVANANIFIKEHKKNLSELGLKQSRLFPKGTLCITIAANIGDVAILDYDCCFPDSVVGFTPNEETISKFVYYYMCVIKADLEHFAPATAQKNINLKILNEILINMPSFKEQQEIVCILDDLFEKEQNAKELYDLIEQIEAMKKTILGQAFRGELGSNDPQEQRAVALLKDILTIKSDC